MDERELYIRLTNGAGQEIGQVTEKQITITINTLHGIRVARTLAYSLLADGETDAANVLFELVGKG